jgi:Tol biopolymer transport system component
MDRKEGRVLLLAAVMALTAAVAQADWVFGTPLNLGPLVNSAGAEGSPEVTADGLELYFNSDRPGGFGNADVWVSKRPTKDAPWGQAENLGPVVNTAGAEISPCISADGLELYFSDYRAPRPGGAGKGDIWVTTRSTRNAPWGPPVNLGPIVNGPGEEVTPEVSHDGLELYFESDRPGGLGLDDLWVARRASTKEAWGRPVWVGATLNAAGNDHCPNLTADGLTLFYDATPVGTTVGDLMVTERATLSSDWGKPVNLGHGPSDHWASSIAADGTVLYFASTRPGGSGGNDIWQVPVTRR